MATIPYSVEVRQSDLLNLRAAFVKYVDSEKARLSRDREILLGMTGFSDLDEVTRATRGNLANLALDELNRLISNAQQTP